MEVETRLQTPVKSTGHDRSDRAVPFSTQFNAEIVNAPCYEKVKMPTLDLYDGTTDSKEHLGMWMTLHTIDFFRLPLKEYHSTA